MSIEGSETRLNSSTPRSGAVRLMSIALVLTIGACTERINHRLAPRTIVEAESLLEIFPYGDYPKNMAPSARWDDWAHATVLHWLATGRTLDRKEPVRHARGTLKELPEEITFFGRPLIEGNPFQLRYDGHRPFFMTHEVPYHMDSFTLDKETPARHVRDHFAWLEVSGAEGIDLSNLLSAVLLARRCGVEIASTTRDEILAELEARTWRQGGRVGVTSQFTSKPDPQDTVTGALLLAVFGQLTPELLADFTPEMSEVVEFDGQIIADRPLFQIMGIALLRNQDW
jgi:hypothetical protein